MMEKTVISHRSLVICPRTDILVFNKSECHVFFFVIFFVEVRGEEYLNELLL